jgi:hypothetical protein
LAVSRITLNHANIRAYFQANPTGGGTVGGVRGGGAGGVAGGQPERLAARMVLAARINAATRFEQRTTSLVTSVVPIVRTGRGGEVEVGVGTTVEHGKWLEVGTRGHVIEPRRPFNPAGRRGSKGRGYLLRSNGPNSKGPNPDPLNKPRMYVLHPGNSARHWLSDAVRQVIPGARVRVRTRD